MGFENLLSSQLRKRDENSDVVYGTRLLSVALRLPQEAWVRLPASGLCWRFALPFLLNIRCGRACANFERGAAYALDMN